MEEQHTHSNTFARVVFIVFGGLVTGILLFAGAVFAYQNSFRDKIYRGVSIDNVIVGGLTRQEAAEKLERELRYPIESSFRFLWQDKVWQASAQELGFHPQTDQMTQTAYNIGRSGGLLDQITTQISTMLHGVTIQPVFLFDERVAFNRITKIAEEIDTPMDDPSIVLQGSEVVIVPGKSGLMLDRSLTMSMLQIYAHNLQSADIDLPVITLEPTEANLGEQKQVLDNLLHRDFVLYTDDERGVQNAGSIPADVLAGMIDFEPVMTDGDLTIEMNPKVEPFYTRLLEIGSSVYKTAQDAKFIFDNSTRSLRLIQQAETGKELDIDKSLENIAEAIRSGRNEAEVALNIIQPKVTGNETAEELGIRELVHTENTYFFYSDDARIQNIQVGAAKLNGVLVAPGETFSMADAVGEVSKETGYAESSVIFGDQTVQDVGGGLCQVSTTLFRAAFNYGLEINERHAHGYRVYYYERLGNRQLDPGLAGLDASVYLPVLDLKFTNDTPYWILMEAQPDLNLFQLQWRFYSTDVNRYVEYTSTGLTNVVPEGEPIYNENPNLPSGYVEQVDWGIDGADVTIYRTVYENGLVHIQDRFDTHYEAWSDIWEYGPGTPGMPPNGSNSEND
ncbi:MAG: VanW family protein [Anaerolineaceae bacterium]|nr:VanW family protein [Anaerolineaceae bacterium]